MRYDSFLDEKVMSLFENDNQKRLIGNLEISEDAPIVDIDKIIEILGLELRTTKFDVHSGKFDSDQNIIYVNTDESQARQRFTKAHELGHFVLKHGESARYIDDSFYSVTERKKETEANKYAVNLLMPEKLIFDLISKYKRNKFDTEEEFFESSPEELVSYLANLLQVSFTSLKYRLLNLNVISEVE